MGAKFTPSSLMASLTAATAGSRLTIESTSAPPLRIGPKSLLDCIRCVGWLQRIALAFCTVFRMIFVWSE